MVVSSVYGLIDPRTDHLRYVGQTVNLKERIAHHLIPSRLHASLPVSRWLRKLSEVGLAPDVAVLEEPEPANLYESEKFWIGYFKMIGCSLLNLHDHGPGGRLKGWHHTDDTKAKLRAARMNQPDPRRGTTHSMETKHRLSVQKTGKPQTEACRLAISRAMTGKKRGPYRISEEERTRRLERMRLLHQTNPRVAHATKGMTLSAERRAAIRVAMIGKKRGPYNIRKEGQATWP